MPIKKLLYRCQPAPLYIVLVLSLCYFTVQLILSHITHALTLLMASYHMLCNIFALGGYIMAIKHSESHITTTTHEKKSSVVAMNYQSDILNEDSSETKPRTMNININEKTEEQQKLSRREHREMKLRNTFGWTRIDILSMLIVCIILASLSFSLLVEALQTIVHIDHQDTMHLPLPIMILGFVGLILNGLTYLLIGGYTIHQGNFLHVTPSGDVVLDGIIATQNESAAVENDTEIFEKNSNESKLQSKLQLDAIEKVNDAPIKRQGAVEMLRDVSSTIFVIVCAVIVYMAQDEEHTAKFIDPILSIFSCVLLVSLSYPYMKESCLILLQTIPGSIDMEIFERTLMMKFPEIVNYHDLHIWQLSAHKSVATVHIKFQSPKIYIKIIDDVRSYFYDQGVTEVTIQPEFHCAKITPSLECLMPCNTPECAEKLCCPNPRAESNKTTNSLSSNDNLNEKQRSTSLSTTNEKNISKTVIQNPKTELQDN